MLEFELEGFTAVVSGGLLVRSIASLEKKSEALSGLNVRSAGIRVRELAIGGRRGERGRARPQILTKTLLMPKTCTESRAFAEVPGIEGGLVSEGVLRQVAGVRGVSQVIAVRAENNLAGRAARQHAARCDSDELGRPRRKIANENVVAVKGKPTDGLRAAWWGVGSTGLFVRSVALLVKASSLPSGLKTGSPARPSRLQTARRCRNQRGRGGGEVSNEDVVRQKRGTEAGYRREIGTVGGQVGHSAGERHGFAIRAEHGAEANALHGKLTARGHAEQGRRAGWQVAEKEVFGVVFPYQPPSVP